MDLMLFEELHSNGTYDLMALLKVEIEYLYRKCSIPMTLFWWIMIQRTILNHI